jgi:tetratricopeptide (TPR) repeat protein
MVESCLERTGISDDRLFDELRRLTESEPSFAEAWLEFGYAYFDRGEYAAAAECFDKSLAFPPVFAAERTSCAAQAAFAKARTINASGRLPEAAQAYVEAFALESKAGMARIGYARLLRRLGRVREALAEFEAGMETDYTGSEIAPLPRQFPALADRLSASFSHSAES